MRPHTEGITMATFKQYETVKGKFWKYRAYLGIDETTGKDKRIEKRGFKTKKEAQLSLSRLQLDYDKNGSVSNTKYTYNDMYLLWLEQYKNTVKESTLAKTQRTFKNHILPFFGQYRIDKIKPTYCQKAINLWHEKKLVKYKIMMNYTSKVFAYAISLNLLTDNPTKRITTPKVIEDVTEDVLKNYYTKEELKLFFDCIQKEDIYRDLTLFRVLAFTGARKGEILSLTWQDINFKDNTIRINKALAQGLNNKLIIQTPKTKTSVRTISIDPKTTEILKEWRKKQKEFYFMQGLNTLSPKQLVFSNHNNELLQPHHTYTVLNKIITKYNLKRITTHGFRHTHCSLLFESGASIQEVQDRLGHSDVQTTMNIYTHVTEKAKEQTADKFAQYVSF